MTRVFFGVRRQSQQEQRDEECTGDAGRGESSPRAAKARRIARRKEHHGIRSREVNSARCSASEKGLLPRVTGVSGVHDHRQHAREVHHDGAGQGMGFFFSLIMLLFNFPRVKKKKYEATKPTNPFP